MGRNKLMPTQHRGLAPFFTRTKHVLQDWARQRRLFLFDAGASERFGCVASDKVLHALWEAERGLASSR
jgi:hypothetical protein